MLGNFCNTNRFDHSFKRYCYEEFNQRKKSKAYWRRRPRNLCLGRLILSWLLLKSLKVFYIWS